MACLWLVPARVSAQEKDYYFTRLTDKDGLSDNNITCILQDKAGFMWIGTYYGLNRYNAYTVERFINDPADTTTLSDNYVTSIVEDKAGVIWVGTSKGGLNTYNPVTKSFVHYKHSQTNSNSLYSNEIDELYIDSANRLWIGYFGYGWSIYNQQQKSFVHYQVNRVQNNAYSQNMYNVIEAFSPGRDGLMWVASNAGLYAQDMRTGAVTVYRDSVKRDNPFLADNLFTSVYRESDTIIWLGTWAGGLKKFNTRTHSFTSYLYTKSNRVFGIHNIIVGVTKKSEDELWVASVDKNLGIFNKKMGGFTFIPNNPSNSSSPLPGECSKVFTDRQGTLWAGYYSGICRWNSQSNNFHAYPITTHSSKYPEVYTNCFYKDTATGLLYTGGEGGTGLYIINETTGRQDIIPFTDTKNFPEENYTIYCIKPYDSTTLLVLAGNGLHLYNKATHTLQKLALTDQEGHALPYGYNLIKDAEGNWWYNSVGIYMLNPTLTKAHRYYEKDIPGLKDLNAVLYIESPQRIWINNNIKGLQLFNPVNGAIQPVVVGNGSFNLREVACVLPADSSSYWVSSFAQGLYMLHYRQGNTFDYVHYGEAQNVPSAFIKGMARDKNGNYWIATRKGPLIYSTAKKTFKLFGGQDGYKVTEWVLDDLYASGNGYIYFTSRDGYVRTHVDSLEFNKSQSPLVLTSLKVAGIEWGDTTDVNSIRQLTLPYNQNFFTAEFALLNYIDAPANKYMYMLSGVDKDYINAGVRRYVSYADLGPGTYTLYVKAANNYGVWIDKPLILTVIIKPPFWRTWWFYILVFFTAGTLIYTGYRYHINTIRKEEKLKTDFTKKVAEIEMKALRAQMNPHFIFNCLNSINRYIIKSDHITASGYLTRFAKLIRLILDNSISDTTSLDNEIQLVQLYIEMETLRFENRFTYSIEASPALQLETTRIPSMLIQPYIENAIWHGLLHKEGTGHVDIRFILHEKNVLKIEIEDNGVGREKSAALKSKNVLKNKSYGMRITGDRINIVNQLYNIKATTAVEDLADVEGKAAGTKISLFIPFETTEIPQYV